MSDLPEKPTDDRHRLLFRWDKNGLEFDAKGFGIALGIIALVTMLCWLFSGVPMPPLKKL
jgi:hypothetical protein